MIALFLLTRAFTLVFWGGWSLTAIIDDVADLLMGTGFIVL